MTSLRLQFIDTAVAQAATEALAGVKAELESRPTHANPRVEVMLRDRGLSAAVYYKVGLFTATHVSHELLDVLGYEASPAGARLFYAEAVHDSPLPPMPALYRLIPADGETLDADETEIAAWQRKPYDHAVEEANEQRAAIRAAWDTHMSRGRAC
jgi:hypothetical protein